MKFILEYISDRVSFKSLALVEVLFLGLTLTDLVDFTLRTLSGLIAVAVGLLAIRNYVLKNRLINKEIEMRDQELNEYLESKRTNP